MGKEVSQQPSRGTKTAMRRHANVSVSQATGGFSGGVLSAQAQLNQSQCRTPANAKVKEALAAKQSAGCQCLTCKLLKEELCRVRLFLRN
jgi:hypothetical protein